MSRKVIALLISFCFMFEQCGFAQVANVIDLSGALSSLSSIDKFRPLHLRSLAYDHLKNDFNLFLDKGDVKNIKPVQVQEVGRKLMEYFQIGIALPDSMFWVNLRPDGEKDMIDPQLAKTDLGKVLLEADLQLKKDMALATSPQTYEGRKYWKKLYEKAESVLGSQQIDIPTLTRPWIVPGEIIVKQSAESAYVYKATLKVMLEQDYLKNSATYNFNDPRLKELNEYSSELIREIVLPRLTKKVNSSKAYAPLRQVYYSLVLAQWFKSKYSGRGEGIGKDSKYSKRMDSQDLTGLISQTAWSKENYFNAYRKSFVDGEYNTQETVNSLNGMTIRKYFSGGIVPMPVLDGQKDVALIPEKNNIVPSDVLAVGSAYNPVDIDDTVKNIIDQDRHDGGRITVNDLKYLLGSDSLMFEFIQGYFPQLKDKYRRHGLFDHLFNEAVRRLENNGKAVDLELLNNPTQRRIVENAMLYMVSGKAEAGQEFNVHDDGLKVLDGGTQIVYIDAALKNNINTILTNSETRREIMQKDIVLLKKNQVLQGIKNDTIKSLVSESRAQGKEQVVAYLSIIAASADFSAYAREISTEALAEITLGMSKAKLSSAAVKKTIHDGGAADRGLSRGDNDLVNIFTRPFVLLWKSTVIPWQVNKYIKELSDPQTMRRHKEDAARILGEMGDTQAIPYLREYLVQIVLGDNYDVYPAAELSLRQLGLNNRDIERIYINAFRDTKYNRLIRSNAVKILGEKNGERRALEELLNWVDEKDIVLNRVIKAAVTDISQRINEPVLGKINQNTGKADKVKGVDLEVRDGGAARDLAKRKDKRSVASLIAALKIEIMPSNRYAICRALVAIGEDASGPLMLVATDQTIKAPIREEARIAIADIAKQRKDGGNKMPTDERFNPWDTEGKVKRESNDKHNGAVREYSSSSSGEVNTGDNVFDGGDKNIDPVGGIDFRGLPVISQPAIGAVRIPVMPNLIGNVALGELDKQWLEIRTSMVQGQMPYLKIREYIAYCNARPDTDKQLEAVLTCVADILKAEEEEALPTSNQLKEILVQLG